MHSIPVVWPLPAVMEEEFPLKVAMLVGVACNRDKCRTHLDKDNQVQDDCMYVCIVLFHQKLYDVHVIHVLDANSSLGGLLTVYTKDCNVNCSPVIMIDTTTHTHTHTHSLTASQCLEGTPTLVTCTAHPLLSFNTSSNSNNNLLTRGLNLHRLDMPLEVRVWGRVCGYAV